MNAKVIAVAAFSCVVMAGWQVQASAADGVADVQAQGGLVVGADTPLFGAPAVDGQPVSLRQLMDDAGKVNGCVALVFFMTTCEPCKAEIQQLIANKTDLEKDGVNFLLVAAGEDKAKVAPFVSRMKIPFKVVTDRFMIVAKLYGITDANMKINVPQTVVVGPDGKVRMAVGVVGDSIVGRIRSACRGAVGAAGTVGAK